MSLGLGDFCVTKFILELQPFVNLSKLLVSDQLNGCIDTDSLNKAVDLLFGLALGNSANDNSTRVSSLLRLFRRFTCCGLSLIVK